MPREATLPRNVVNVPGDYFSMAGFEVTLYGRFWVTPEGGQLGGTENSIEGRLRASAGTDGFIDPQVYQQERQKAKMGPDEFDKRYGYLLSPQEQKRLGIAGGVQGNNQFLSSDYLRALYGEDELFELSGTKLGFFERDKDQKKRQAVDEYLNALMAKVEQYRQAGFTDDQILKMMQK